VALGCAEGGPEGTTCPRATQAEQAAIEDPQGIWEVRWDRTFAGWSPPIFVGRLTLQRSGEQWTGSLQFWQSTARPTFESLRVVGDKIDVLFRVDTNPGPDKELELRAWIHEDRLIGEIKSGSVDWTPVGGRRTALLRYPQQPPQAPTQGAAPAEIAP
jgi:hypothetical protein